MNTFVPEGADYYKGAMSLDLPRLRKQLVEVQLVRGVRWASQSEFAALEAALAELED